MKASAELEDLTRINAPAPVTTTTVEPEE